MSKPNNTTPLGDFRYLLAIDCETTGINYTSGNPSDDYQAISWGILVINAYNFEIVHEKYIEIQWDGVSKWSKGAEGVHGLSKQHLLENGVTEEEGITQIAEIVLKYWPLNVSINLLGHNVHLFDKFFLEKLFKKFDMKLNFTQRHVDSFSVFFTLLHAFNSEDGFTTMGCPPRKLHNALEDIKMTVESLRRIKVIWDSKVGIHTNNYD